MSKDMFFEELFGHDGGVKVGSAEADENAERTVGEYSNTDIVVNADRRSGKPTVAGTRLEPKIMAERVFKQTLDIMVSLLNEDVFSKNSKEKLVGHYRDHPHDVPLIVPISKDWLSYHKVDDISYNIYGSKVKNAYKLSVIEVATRRDYTYPRMIHAMCQFYDDNRENMEVLRRRSYDTRFALSSVGDSKHSVQLVEDKNDLDGFFVSETGDRYENYAEFTSDCWDSEWPPNPTYLDHKATFGVERPSK